MRISGAFAALCTFVAVGCAPVPTYHQDIKPLLDARCATCHYQGGPAPFSLTSFKDAKAVAAQVADAVAAGRMPPWKAGPADVGYLDNPSLTDEQKASVAAWVKAGALEGNAAQPGKPLPTLGGKLEHVDLSLAMPEAYTPRLSPDDYRCFVLRWPQAGTSYITGVNAVPGVIEEAHHIALYMVPPDSAHLPVQWDAEDALAGYECFGGPFGSRPQTFPVGLVAAWIPGVQGLTFPRGGGIAVPPGATLVLQMHYNTASVAPRADVTKMEFQVASSVTRKMAYQPFLNPGWVAGDMAIPAGNAEVVHQHLADPRDFFSLLGSPLSTTNGFNIEGVMFHMHTLGRSGQLYLERPAKGDQRAQKIKVLDIPRWEFNWQQQYMLDTPVRFEPGDKLRVRCVFDNSIARGGEPSPKASNWGEGTGEEMCVANVLSSE